MTTLLSLVSTIISIDVVVYHHVTLCLRLAGTIRTIYVPERWQHSSLTLNTDGAILLLVAVLVRGADLRLACLPLWKQEWCY